MREPAKISTGLLLAILATWIFSMVVVANVARAQSWWDKPAIRACCSVADAVYADDWIVQVNGSIKARVTGGGPRSHLWAPIGREYIIPAGKVLREPGNPTGQALLFLMPSNLNHIYCFAIGPMT